MTLAGRLLVAILLLSSLVDLPGQFEFGPVSGLALLTIGYAGTSWLLLLAQGRLTRTAFAVVVPILLLSVWGLWTFTWADNDRVAKYALQNLLVFITFAGLVLLSARESCRAADLQASVGRYLTCATLAAAALYGSTVLLDGVGTERVIGARSFALFALIGLAWNVAGWRYGSRRAMWVAAGIVIVIVISLSRLALVVGLALFPMALLGARRATQWIRALAWTAIAAGILTIVIERVEPVRARFFEGDLSMRAGDVAINVSGRRVLWEATMASFAESPWVGKGAGTASIVADSAVPGVGHPHSEYLRILHDYGIFGMALWLLGIGRLVLAAWRAWVRADRIGDPSARIHLATLLATGAVSIAMITDNTVVYPFVMAPFAILVGASLGRPSPVRLPAARPIDVPMRATGPWPARARR